MYSPTFGELKTNLQMELDLQEEGFITDNEFLAYGNEAVDMIEASIHTIYEDYFLTSAPLAIVNGTQAYALPSDIYAQKIRAMYYNDGSSTIYEIKRLKKLQDIPMVLDSDPYRYVIVNRTSANLKVEFYPTPNETTPTNITLWYIRNASKFVDETTVCDIPEFTPVITQYMRWKCLDKEGHPSTATAKADLERMKKEMIETLTARVPDEDNEIIQDMSFYNDFDTGFDTGGY